MEKSYFKGVDNCLKPLLKKGVDQGVFSGVAVGLYKSSKEGDEKLIICHGKTKNDSRAIPVKDTTLFDLASLTKPLCTVLAILHLIETNKIKWNTPVGAVIGTKTPFFLKNVQITNLLSHSSGLKAYKPFYKDFQPEQAKENKKRLLDSLFNEQPVYTVGEKCVYSDLGYILLGEIIERVSCEKLNVFFASKVVGPLGLEKQVMFRPVDTYATRDPTEIAATQNCPWRQRLLQGEVDDEHCWLMNGVAGHAGLFGTVHGVLDLTAHILNQWQGREEHPSYSNTLLQRALTRQHNDQVWCLGFDTPSPTGSSGGNYISKESVGHLGFTGTSFWIDREKDMVIVLLTNRVHPARDNEKIKQFRPLLHDTVFQAMQIK
jgi:CubicO group peptidase (beta-lactamase class C family)